MVNPNPGLITEPMWKLWTDRPNPAWKLGGFYANKPGYHNTVNTNLQHWPGNYSVRVSLDLVVENRNKSRAIDLTMSDSEMVKWTTRMRNSALDPLDNRLEAVREFYGTLNNKTVFGLSKTGANTEWERSYADETHLWHGHVSIFTAFVNNWLKLQPLLSVWGGETFSEWSMGNMELPRKGDSGENVRYWQHVYNAVRGVYPPACPELKVDGDYGPTTASAFTEFWKRLKGAGTYNGSYLSGWIAVKMQEAFIKVRTPVQQVNPPINEEQLKRLVNGWLATNIPAGLKFTGEVEGSVKLP